MQTMLKCLNEMQINLLVLCKKKFPQVNGNMLTMR